MLLRVDTTTLSRWENNGQVIGPQADSLMRLMYFYLLAEKQDRAIPEHVADQIAAVVTQRSDAVVLLVNPCKPVRYSYRLESELASPEIAVVIGDHRRKHESRPVTD